MCLDEGCYGGVKYDQMEASAKAMRRGAVFSHPYAEEYEPLDVELVNSMFFVKYNNKLLTVAWRRKPERSTFGHGIHVTNVQAKVGGVITLSDGSEFMNPAHERLSMEMLF